MEESYAAEEQTEGAVESFQERDSAPAVANTHPNNVFRVKHVRIRSENVNGGKMSGFNDDSSFIPIVLQNENGPCPLLAACNCLLFRGSIQLPGGPSIRYVSVDTLVELLAEKILDTGSSLMMSPHTITRNDRSDSGNHHYHADANAQQNVADAIDILPTLAQGLDVNVGFSSIQDFEFTAECAVFDILNIRLVHGWLIDENDTQTKRAVNHRSYNQIVERLITLNSRRAPKTVSVALSAGNVEYGKARNKDESLDDEHVQGSTISYGIPGSSEQCATIPPGDDEEERQLKAAMAISLADTTDLIDFSDSVEIENNTENSNTESSTVDADITSATIAKDERNDVTTVCDQQHEIIQELVEDLVMRVIDSERALQNDERFNVDMLTLHEEDNRVNIDQTAEDQLDSSNDEELSMEEFNERTALRDFLETSSSQLTYTGLMALHEGIKPNEFAGNLVLVTQSKSCYN